MEPVFFILAGAGLATLAGARSASAHRERAWKHAAEVARLEEVRVEKRMGFVSRLSGRRGALSVRLERYRRGKYEGGTRLVVGGLQHAPDELTLRRASLGSAVGKALGRREVQLGDPWFDQSVYIQGSRELACVLLDAETRRAVLRLLEGYQDAPSRRGIKLGPNARAWLADGEVRLELPGRFGERVAVALPVVLGVAERLVRPPDIAAPLARNLGQDPDEGVRLANLQAILERHHKHPQAREALEKAARRDGSEEVRLRAALAVGTGGWDSLLAIASSGYSDDERAARAIAGLGQQLSSAQAQAILADSLRGRRIASAKACLESLGQRDEPDLAGLFARVLAVEKGPLAAAAARALAVTAEAAAEAPLVEALGQDHYPPDVLAALARELGRVGSVAAVVPLREAAERHGDGDLRRAARQAVAEIQARQQGAAPGQLSIAAGEAGQVTLVDEDAKGRVSMPDLPDT